MVGSTSLTPLRITLAALALATGIALILDAIRTRPPPPIEVSAKP
jgi:hypothetical protein